MARISDKQVSRTMLTQLQRNRASVNKFAEEVSSGYKVVNPGDSRQSGTIAQYRDTLGRIEGFQTRVNFAEGYIVAQDNSIAQAVDVTVRAQEIAEQAANGTVSPTARAQMAAEVYELREHLVNLANTTFQGRYIYSGSADDQPAFSLGTPYTVPGTGGFVDQHYEFNTNPGATTSRNVSLTDTLDMELGSTGNEIFLNGINALERLGRALSGYQTGPAAGTPIPTDPGNIAYVFPADYALQTADIRASLDLLAATREADMIPERADIGGKMRRLETARSLLELGKASTQTALTGMQDADVAESASNLAQAETGLEASYITTNKLLQISILDYL